MHLAFGDFYSSFPLVTIDECVDYQFAANEAPFYPQQAVNGLGLAYRKPTDNYEAPEPNPISRVPGN